MSKQLGSEKFKREKYSNLNPSIKDPQKILPPKSHLHLIFGLHCTQKEVYVMQVQNLVVIANFNLSHITT